METINKKIIMGLDVSTTTIGCSIVLVNETGKRTILKVTHVTPKISSKIKGIEALFLKKQIFEETFLKNYIDFGITDVVIEEPLLRSNNVGVVSTLLKFNALISEGVYNKLGIVPAYISSYDARLYSYPNLLTIRKFDKKGVMYPLTKIKRAIKNNELVLFGDYSWDVEKKHVMLNHIVDEYPDIEWVYDKNGDLKKESFDCSDSLICCFGYLNRIENGDMVPKIIQHSDDDENIYYEVDIWGEIYKHKITKN